MQYSTVAPKEARALRRAFINKFADKKLPQYRAVMGHGDTYGSFSHNGYIWEVLRPYTLISFERALAMLRDFSELYVTWDNKSFGINDKPFKSLLLKVSGVELANAIDNERHGLLHENAFLPEDVYVFNESIDFHVTFTNQNIEGIGKLCITSRNDIDDTGISSLMRELISVTGFGEGDGRSDKLEL